MLYCYVIIFCTVDLKHGFFLDMLSLKVCTNKFTQAFQLELNVLGETAYVLTKDPQPLSPDYWLWNPSCGTHYSQHEPHTPLISIGCVISDTNVRTYISRITRKVADCPMNFMPLCLFRL